MKEIYLDYSATTKPEKEVIQVYNDAALENYYNANSVYKVSQNSKKRINKATSVIAEILNVREDEIIYTSGASESNNLAIKGIALKNNGNHIITTSLEHPSVIATMSYLQTIGFKIDFVKTDSDGLINLKHLEELITDKTVLVSIGAVSSELGIRQNVEEIGMLLKKYENCIFHVDMTQCLGKDLFDLTNIDLASFSAHKIYGLKGIGMLYKKQHIKLIPQINGGKSTSIYRSGTPDTAGICAFSKAIELVTKDLEKDIRYVNKLSIFLKNELAKNKNIVINSTKYSIPHIINISVLNVDISNFVSYLEQNNIYISTKTACSDSNSASMAVMSLYNNEERANSTIRISLSKYTTKEELDAFIKIVENYFIVRNK